MATLNPSMDHTRQDEPARTRTLARLFGGPAFWLALAAVGLTLIIVGLGVDAYRHKHGAGADALFSSASPGFIIAACGFAVALVGILAAFSIVVLAGATADQVMRRGAGVVVVWTVACSVAAAGGVYLANSGLALSHEGHGAADGHAASAQPAHAPQVAVADADHAHDRGRHATFTQLMESRAEDVLPMFPDGSVSAADLPALRGQIARVHEVAQRFPTQDAARTAGYFSVSADVESMGHHWISAQYLADGVFDPARPEGLLFSKIDDGEPRLVGVWFLQSPGSGGATEDAPPPGFAGDLDVWHGHTGICLTQDAASEGGNEVACRANGGQFVQDARWMMHVWVAPETSENPDGFFAYLNEDLAARQVAPAPLRQFGEF